MEFRDVCAPSPIADGTGLLIQITWVRFPPALLKMKVDLFCCGKEMAKAKCIEFKNGYVYHKFFCSECKRDIIHRKKIEIKESTIISCKTCGRDPISLACDYCTNYKNWTPK